MREIVIKIDEGMYEDMLTDFDLARQIVRSFQSTIANAIQKGVSLPEGHGRLIDADELKSMSYEVLVDDGNPNRADGLSACNGLVEDDIDLAPTIIEADKENT